MMTAKFSQKNLKILFKIVVSVGLIIWLLFNIDLAQILRLCKDANWHFLVLIAPIIFIACIFINVLRWKLILKQQEINSPFWQLFAIYIKGTFLSSFLPGGITTGDIYRMYSLGRDTGKKALSISSVLMERAIGVFSLLTLSLVSLYYSIFITNNEIFVPLVIPVLFMTALFSTVSAFSIIFIKRGYFNKIKSNNSIMLKLQNFINTIPNYFSNKTILVEAFLLSLLFQFTIVVWTYAVSYAMDISISFLVLCVTIPLINLLTILPLSIGGIGVRETAYVFFLVPFGLEPSEAISISLISVLLQTVLRLLAGAVFFWGVSRQTKANFDE